jgi:hypothetical protein
MKKRRFPSWLTIVALLPVVSACRSQREVRDSGPAPSAGDGDAGAPLALELQIEIRLPDGGFARASLDPSAPALLPVTPSLDVTSNLPLHNYRLRILDELDRALASNDSPEETRSGLRYHIALLAPLRSGHRYTVLLDAQSGATLDNGRGVAVNEQRFEFRTEGEREKDAPSKVPAKRHHRRANGT